jgi:hypothetical protein
MLSNSTWLIMIVGLVFLIGMISGVYIFMLDRLRKQILDLKCERGVFKARSVLMNSSEHFLFNLLKAHFANSPYDIFVQVDMAALIMVTDKAVDYYNTLEDLDKSIDFVITDSEVMKPVLAIELNGPEHNRDSRRVRDQYLKRIFTDCHLPFLFIPVSALSDKQKVIATITSILNTSLS